MQINAISAQPLKPVVNNYKAQSFGETAATETETKETPKKNKTALYTGLGLAGAAIAGLGIWYFTRNPKAVQKTPEKTFEGLKRSAEILKKDGTKAFIERETGATLITRTDKEGKVLSQTIKTNEEKLTLTFNKDGALLSQTLKTPDGKEAIQKFSEDGTLLSTITKTTDGKVYTQNTLFA